MTMKQIKLLTKVSSFCFEIGLVRPYCTRGFPLGSWRYFRISASMLSHANHGATRRQALQFVSFSYRAITVLFRFATFCFFSVRFFKEFNT